METPFLIFFASFTFFVVFPTNGALRGVSWAEDFPSREIKLVVPLPPGGAGDLGPRILADKVGKILGVPLVVVNSGAGGGVVGVLSVVQAKPDGYTLLAAGATAFIILKPFLVPDLPYRYTDVTPVCGTIVVPVMFMVNNEAPWKSLKELVDHAKKNPGKLRASVGAGVDTTQVLLDLFKAEAAIDIIDIPTKGGVGAPAALMGGHAELGVASIAGSADLLRAGRMRALVCTHKVPEFPTIKTFEEENYPRVSLKLWHAIFAPNGLPQQILTKLAKAFESACNDPSIQEQLRKLSFLTEYRSPEETSKIIESDREIALKILKQSGLVK